MTRTTRWKAGWCSSARKAALSGVLGVYAYQRDQDLHAFTATATTFKGNDKVTTLATYADGELALERPLVACWRACVPSAKRKTATSVYNGSPIKARYRQNPAATQGRHQLPVVA